MTRRYVATALISQFVVLLLIQDSMSPDETSFRESFLFSFQDVILFVPSMLCRGPPASSSVCYGMHDGPETGNTAAGLENLRS